MDEEEDTFEQIQVIALKNFLHPDEDAFYRRLCRWFATTFHTSIFEVENKPLEYILLHYQEHRLEQMTKEEVNKQIRFVTNKEEVVSEDDQDQIFAEQLELSYIKQKQAELAKQNQVKAQEKSMPPDIKLEF